MTSLSLCSMMTVTFINHWQLMRGTQGLKKFNQRCKEFKDITTRQKAITSIIAWNVTTRRSGPWRSLWNGHSNWWIYINRCSLLIAWRWTGELQIILLFHLCQLRSRNEGHVEMLSHPELSEEPFILVNLCIKLVYKTCWSTPLMNDPFM